MRLLVFYDLPVTSQEKRQAYQHFHHYLLRDGFDMMQFSVYVRICNGLDAANKHFERLKKNLPPEGSVRCMRVTEKQFTDLVHLVGTPSIQEKSNNTEQLSLF